MTQHLRALDGLTAGSFAKYQLAAQAGDSIAQGVVQAALADNTTTTGAGLIPTRFLRDVISVLDARRPVVDSITREALPDAGDEFKIPRVTQKPSVAEQVAEGDEVSSTAFTLDFLTVPVKTFAGGERISRQLIERSDPAFLDRLLAEMAAQYAQKTDAYAYSVLISGEGNSEGATIYGAVADAIADAWSVMRFPPDRLLVGPTGTGTINYSTLLAAVDGEDRPLFASANPSNAAGLISQGTTQGTVAGLQVVVDANLGDIESRVYPSAAATFYESAGSPINVSVQDVSTLEVEVAVYGYVACAIKYPTAVRRTAVTP
jgi:hypothetical protein